MPRAGVRGDVQEGSRLLCTHQRAQCTCLPSFGSRARLPSCPRPACICSQVWAPVQMTGANATHPDAKDVVTCPYPRYGWSPSLEASAAEASVATTRSCNLIMCTAVSPFFSPSLLSLSSSSSSCKEQFGDAYVLSTHIMNIHADRLSVVGQAFFGDAAQGRVVCAFALTAALPFPASSPKT